MSLKVMKSRKPKKVNRKSKSQKPVKKSQKPVKKSRKRVKKSRKPKKTSRKPVKKSRKPKKTSRKPKKTSRKPKKTSRKPVKKSRKPVKKSRKPVKKSRKPKKTSRKPKKTSRKPKKTSRKPKKTSRKPVKKSRKPKKTSRRTYKARTVVGKVDIGTAMAKSLKHPVPMVPGRFKTQAALKEFTNNLQITQKNYNRLKQLYSDLYLDSNSSPPIPMIPYGGVIGNGEPLKTPKYVNNNLKFSIAKYTPLKQAQLNKEIDRLVYYKEKRSYPSYSLLYDSFTALDNLSELTFQSHQ